MVMDFKPIAKSTLWGSLIGGIGGFAVAGAGGAIKGANFCGSIGAQVGMYNKGEDLADKAVQSAGRKFEEMTERLGVNAEKNLNRFTDKIIVATEKVVNAYTKASITGYSGTFALEFSRFTGLYAKEICASENEWMQCYGYRMLTATLACVSLAACFSLYKDIKKLKEEGLFHASP